MSKTTTDPGTPIFGELNKEFELPEIVVHDFDEHAFQLQEISLTEEAAEPEAAADGTSSETAESDHTPADLPDSAETGQDQDDQSGKGQGSKARSGTKSGSGQKSAANQKSTAAHAGTEASATVKNAPKRPGGRRRKEE